MRIQILSDIHAEFHSDNAEHFIEKYLRPKEADVLICAGDLACSQAVPRVLSILLNKYKGVPVLYVPGNHEFYDSSIPAVLGMLRKMEREVDNFTLLHNKMVNINGTNFMGSVLWFRKKKDYQLYASALNDFRCIKDFVPRVFEENKKARNFLNWHLHHDSVVVTHHAPSSSSIPSVYMNDPINMFYVCDLARLILKRKPKLWIHGHTHTSFNYMLGDTHVVCNPFGYLGHALNSDFVANMLIEV